MITLTVNGEIYSGWLSVRVVRSLDQLAHSFDLRTIDRWGTSEELRPIRLGDACSVEQDGQTIITGWVDRADYDVTHDSVTLTFAGRSRTGDLVDCSAIHKTGQWRNTSMARIVDDILAPFEIEQEIGTSDEEVAKAEPIARFDLEDCESAFDSIDRLARLRGLLPTTTPEGNLWLRRISRTAGGQDTATLDVSASTRRSVQLSAQDRYSEYRVRSQTARHDPGTSPRAAALEKISVSDSNVKRYRPKVLHTEHGATLTEIQAMATWHRNTAVARAERVIYEVVGLVSWAPGQLVEIRDTSMGIAETLVLASTSLSEDASGSTTELQFTRVEAYTAEPLPEKDLIHKQRKRRGGGTGLSFL